MGFCESRAQETGVLDPGPSVARKGTAAEGIIQRARLVVDPALQNPVRASVWGMAIRAHSDDSEVKIQANLAEIFKLGNTALSLSLIEPVSKDGAITELADLDGLVGTTRGELAWTHDIAQQSTIAKYYARVTGSAPRFEYRTPAGLAKEETRKATVSGSAGVAFVEVDNVFRLGYRHENGFKAADERSICTPVNVGVPNAVECEAVALGPPASSTKNVIDFEYRRTLGNYTSFVLAVAHDVDNGVTGFDLPIWFIPDVHDKFGGGIRVGFRSDQKKSPTLSIFIGQFKP